jgi:hypothetical protein
MDYSRPFGEIAIDLGYLSASQVEEIFNLQAAARILNQEAPHNYHLSQMQALEHICHFASVASQQNCIYSNGPEVVALINTCQEIAADFLENYPAPLALPQEFVAVINEGLAALCEYYLAYDFAYELSLLVPTYQYQDL